MGQGEVIPWFDDHEELEVGLFVISDGGLYVGKEGQHFSLLSVSIKDSVVQFLHYDSLVEHNLHGALAERVAATIWDQLYPGMLKIITPDSCHPGWHKKIH